MKYCVDVDGVICNDTKGKYEDAVPFIHRIIKLNQLFHEGHTIIYFTARGGTTGINWEALTIQQLSKWDVCYHKLIMGKPDCDIFIDDKGINSDEFFKE
jgi:hypothetical protein